MKPLGNAGRANSPALKNNQPAMPVTATTATSNNTTGITIITNVYYYVTI